MDTLRIGIIGCGWFGNFHLDHLLTRPDVAVTALASSNAEKLSQTGERVPAARRYATARALVEAGGVDALIVCVPPDRHEGIEALAAARGIHLYVEKPLGVDLGEVRVARDAIRAGGVVCAVGYQARYENGVDEMRAFLREHPAALAQARWIGGEPGAPWWRVRARSGGQVVEQSTHLLDLMRYLLGEARAVYATAEQALPAPLPGGTVDGGSQAVIWFDGGAVATLASGCFQRPGAPDSIGLRAFCAAGEAALSWREGVHIRTGDAPRAFAPSGCTHARALDAFLAAVRAGDVDGVRSPYDDAIETLRLSLAIEESIRTGQRVALD